MNYSLHRKLFLNVLIPLVVVSGDFSEALATGKVLHEGWFKVLSGGSHAGYLVQRYDFDSNKKQYTSVYFLRTSALGGDIIESLEAKADEKFNPISFKFSTASQKETKIIDALMTKGNELKITQVINGKKETLSRKVNKGTFLSTFLIYLVMRNGGLKVGNNYRYSAIAEEDATLHDGEAFISATQKIDERDTFRILNNFKGTKFISSVSPTGEVVSTRAPVESIETVQVGSIEDAVGAVPFAEKSIKALFGSLPVANPAFSLKTSPKTTPADQQEPAPSVSATPTPTKSP